MCTESGADASTPHAPRCQNALRSGPHERRVLYSSRQSDQPESGGLLVLVEPGRGLLQRGPFKPAESLEGLTGE